MIDDGLKAQVLQIQSTRNIWDAPSTGEGREKDKLKRAGGKSSSYYCSLFQDIHEVVSYGGLSTSTHNYKYWDEHSEMTIKK